MKYQQLHTGENKDAYNIAPPPRMRVLLVTDYLDHATDETEMPHTRDLFNPDLHRYLRFPRQLVRVAMDDLMPTAGIDLNGLFPDGCCQIVVQKPEDLKPATMIANVPALAKLVGLRDLLIDLPASFCPEPQFYEPFIKAGFSACWFTPLQPIRLIHCIDRLLEQIISQVLQDAKWQRCESLVRSLELLEASISNYESCEIAVLTVDIGQIIDDIDLAEHAEETLLYDTVFTEAFDQLGATPYSVVLIDWAFGGNEQQEQLLAKLAKISVLSNSLFLLPYSLGVLHNALGYCYNTDAFLSMARRHNQTLYPLRSDEISANLVLCLPALHHIQDAELFWQAVPFAVSSRVRQARQVPISTCYLLLIHLLRSFSETYMCFNVAGLRCSYISAGADYSGYKRTNHLMVSTHYSDEDVRYLVSFGYTVLTSYWQGHDSLYFPMANTVRWGKLFDDADIADFSIRHSLSYRFMFIRVIHLIKLYVRDFIGKELSDSELESSINSYLSNFIFDGEPKSKVSVYRRPFKKLSVRVERSKAASQSFTLRIEMLPHFVRTEQSLLNWSDQAIL